MKNHHTNPFILGFFIIGGFGLAVLAFLTIGTTNIWRPSGRFTIYMTDSVQGIATGTDVRFQGIRVGEVDSMRIIYDRQACKSTVAVVCSVNKDILDDSAGRPIHITSNGVLRKLIAEGLRAQIDTAGIVGEKFVELDFKPSAQAIEFAGLPASQFPVVPTVRSTMSQITDNVSRIVDRLKETDIAGMAEQAKDVLQSARNELDQFQTNNVAGQISSAAASFGQFMKSSDLRETVTRIDDAALQLRGLITNLDARVPPLATNLDKTLGATGDTLRDVGDFISLRNELGEQTRQLMEQLDQTARDIQQLADFLDRHPNALIAGRARDHSP